MSRDREALRGLRNIATTIREKVLKPNATLQGREYVQLGIDLNNALDAANDILALPVGGGVADLLGAAEWVIDAWNGGDDARFQEALACLNDAILQASSSKPREES